MTFFNGFKCCISTVDYFITEIYKFLLNQWKRRGAIYTSYECQQFYSYCNWRFLLKGATHIDQKWNYFSYETDEKIYEKMKCEHLVKLLQCKRAYRVYTCWVAAIFRLYDNEKGKIKRI